MQKKKFELKMEKLKLENDVGKLMHIKNLKSLKMDLGVGEKQIVN
jgi:hypothetical protein